MLPFISFVSVFLYPATDTDGDQRDSGSDRDSRTMRANHAAIDPIFTQYFITP
jgi:hypothetical protein